MIEQELLTAAHSSLAVRWGTSAPYALGTPRLQEVGFAHCKMLVIPFHAPEDAVYGGAMTPILRQRAYSYLGEHGLPPEAIESRPTVGQETYYGGRRIQMFTNENEAAADRRGNEIPVGARKRGLNGSAMFEFVADEGKIKWVGYGMSAWKEQ